MPYTSHTEEDRRAMFDALGIDSEDDLFGVVPESHRVRELLDMETGRTEPEVLRRFAERASRDRPAAGAVSFLGGGVYDHTVPAAVRNLASRPEFATAYTPYQAEVSQGTLQVIFEFQTHIARLTGLPVANASMYDAASGLAEAALMAARVTRRDRVLLPASLHPRYRAVVERIGKGQDIVFETVPTTEAGDLDADALRGRLDGGVAAVVVQTPSYFGTIERPWNYAQDVHDAGALVVAAVDPVSLSVLRPPGEWGADVAVGEAQPLGNDMSFGGPLLGFMACSEKLIRRMPGRIVSATRDADGRAAFVLTLQTREQHIRREKATSNICSNQGLLAARATFYLSLLGETGFTELGRRCFASAHKLAIAIASLDGYSLRYGAPFFREFVVGCPRDASEVVDQARAHGVFAGIALSKYFGKSRSRELLVAVTEKHEGTDFEALCSALDSAR